VAVGPAGDFFSFNPSSLTINATDTVTWVWASGPHSTTSGSCVGVTCTASGVWDSGIQATGFQYPVTFPNPGSFPYYCAQHGSVMTGTITVNAVSAVTLRSLTAARVPNGVRVRWRTASSVGTLGFNVYRDSSTGRVKVNRSLIPARGNGTSAAAYSVVDRRAPRAGSPRYSLQTIDLDGTKNWHGPVVVHGR
jgi:plastocyanin